MKLALAQCRPRDLTGHEAIARLQDLAARASAQSADVLLIPELFFPGYNVPALHRDLAQPLDGDWVAGVRGIARAHRLGIVLGWAERDQDQVYNAATAVGPDGTILGHHRKRQLFGEMEHDSFAQGTTPPPVFELAGRRCGLLICYEIEFPEHARDLARRGAEVVFVPTANPTGYEHVQSLLVPARACENRQFVAYANYCGSQNGLDFAGESVIAGPDGRALATADRQDAELIVDLPDLAAYPAEALSTQLTDLIADR